MAMFTDDSSCGSKRTKNIVLCFDGTNENFGAQPFTNVLKIYQMLDNTDDDSQMCYYQPGIGTSASFDYVVDVRRRFTTAYFRNTLDSMIAFGLDKNIKMAYLFLVKYYERGDKVYMFGFSRGAFIARVLSGMLERVGLLNRGLEEMVGMAWKIYECWEFAEQPTEANYTSTLIEEFKKTFCRSYSTRIHFQGLFDSVNSVGIFRDRLFPCTQRSNVVDHVRHAVSLDERRGKFKQQSFAPNPQSPKMFSLQYSNRIQENYDNYVQIQNRTNEGLSILTFPEQIESPANASQDNLFLTESCDSSSLDKSSQESEQNSTNFLTSIKSKGNKTTQISKTQVGGSFVFDPVSTDSSLDSPISMDLVEKWFPGDHSDVGGGWSVDQYTHESLSNIPLRWMLAEAVTHGVKFKPRAIHTFAEASTSAGALFAMKHDLLDFKDPPCMESYLNNLELSKNINKDMMPALWSIKVELERAIEAKKRVARSEEEVLKEIYRTECGRFNRLTVLFWWCLELIPIGLRTENNQGKWKSVYIPNFGRKRYVPPYGDMHWSVYWRIRFLGDYRPSNLPAYSKQLVKDFENIELKKFRAQEGYARGSTQISYPDTSEVTKSTKLKDTQEGPFQFLISKLMYNGMVNMLYRKTRRKFVKWSENCWNDVPDDLSSILKKYPDI